MSEELKAKIESMPIRVERLGGQRTSYVQRDDVLAYIEQSTRPTPNTDQLVFVGYTNGAQVSYVKGDEGEGSMFSDTDHGCHIPLYMLKNHEHRIQTTGGPSVFDRIAELKANTDQLVEALMNCRGPLKETLESCKAKGPCMRCDLAGRALHMAEQALEPHKGS